MKLRRKIRKLFTGESLASANKHLRRKLRKPKFPLDRQRIIDTINLDEFAKIRLRYETDPASKRWSKYLQLEHWIDINIQRIRRTGLDAKPSQRVLDLGCGAGYFIYIAQLLGHDCVGLDTDEQRMFTETTRLLEIERVIWPIRPFVPLPPLGKKFDLITAYRICFNNHKCADLWGVSEWEFFLDDLAKLLAPRGRVWLELNLERDETFYPSELRNFFLSKKAKIKGSRILFEC